MKININDFLVHKDLAISQYKKFGIDCLALYSATSVCPIIAVYKFVRDSLEKDSPDYIEITRRIKSVQEFYRYNKVIGLEE